MGFRTATERGERIRVPMYSGMKFVGLQTESDKGEKVIVPIYEREPCNECERREINRQREEELARRKNIEHDPLLEAAMRGNIRAQRTYLANYIISMIHLGVSAEEARRSCRGLAELWDLPEYTEKEPPQPASRGPSERADENSITDQIRDELIADGLRDLRKGFYKI